MRSIIILSTLLLFSCGSDITSKSTSSKDYDLIDTAIGSYHGFYKLKSQTNGNACNIKITKLSAEQISINSAECSGRTLELILDNQKSTLQTLIFRNRKGQVIARWMSGAFSYQLPIENDDVEHFKGRIDK